MTKSHLSSALTLYFPTTIVLSSHLIYYFPFSPCMTFCKLNQDSLRFAHLNPFFLADFDNMQLLALITACIS